MTDEQFKVFKRYLKERGLYSEFFRQAKAHSDRRLGLTIKGYIDRHCTAGEEIMGLITWSEARWGHWNEEYIKYREFLKPIIAKSINKEKYYEHIQKVKKAIYTEELQ